MKILQITDPHLYGSAGGKLRGVETDASLRNVLEDAFNRVPDFAAVLVTGDLVQDDPAGYLRFRSIFGDLQKPVLCIPGNHDEPEVMRHTLAQPPFQVCGTYAAAGWQFVMLDSYDPGHVGGRLGARELERLDEALAKSPAHAMVCLHHHPVDTGCQWLDTIGLANADEFWRVIDAHANVRAVAWGHVHQQHDDRRGAVRLYATPSTGAQFLPDSDRYAIDSRPPAYRSFTLYPDGRIDSEVRWVEALPMRQAAAAR
jgi:Icc protein